MPPREIKRAVDNLGRELHNKWLLWSTGRIELEKEWLEDLASTRNRHTSVQTANDKTNYESDNQARISKLRVKAYSAYSRVIDLLFHSNDEHWSLQPTPIPTLQDGVDIEDDATYQDLLKRSKLMKKEMQDRLIDLKYEENLKRCVFEACIIGTGVIKGVVPTVKKLSKWTKVDNQWQLAYEDIPAPFISSPSLFDVYIDPFAKSFADMTGAFERHVLNLNQFIELKDDSRFFSDVIDDIISRKKRGNHQPLSHELVRRNIAGVSTSVSEVDGNRFDIFEYWGQVSGEQLKRYIDDVDELGVYWANVWFCDSETIYAKLSPMARQQIPYKFFAFNEVLYQLTGIAAPRMGRGSSNGMNRVIGALAEGLEFTKLPQTEVNANFLRDDEDATNIYSGKVWLRDKGSPQDQAVRFYQPQIPTAAMMQVIEMFDRFIDDETMMPAYTYGDQSREINKTAQGTSMLMGAAAIPIKQVIKNLENGVILPLLISLFDWIMYWSDRDEIKGDIDVVVLASSSLVAKEVRSQTLNNFLNLTNNPVDHAFVDRRYLLREAAVSMDIDADKALPEQNPNAPQQDPKAEQINQMNMQMLQMKIDKLSAEFAAVNVKTQYEAVQTALQVLSNPKVLRTTDALLDQAGFKDHSVAEAAQGQPIQSAPDPNANTSPLFPPVPQQPEPVISSGKGIETSANDG